MMPEHSLEDLRQDYRRDSLDERSAPEDPMTLFDQWFGEAQEAKLHEPNAMTVATVSADGQPSARTVLLKGYGHDGFRFFTGYESQKGRELAANPKVALLFYWGELERQVRVEGTATRLSREESDRYFHSRPRGSQTSAFASRQSEVIESREALDAAFAHAEATWEGRDVPLPDTWGGYLVVPARLEFWQGRPSRRHDRVRYDLQPGAIWVRSRLAP